MFDVGVLLNRLDQLEEQHKIMKSLVNQHELKISNHELKIISQQLEINQLKKKNVELETNKGSIQAGDDATSRDFLPRSCFELKATNPDTPSGNYSIDPDGQIGSDQPILVHCDMTTRNILFII